MASLSVKNGGRYLSRALSLIFLLTACLWGQSQSSFSGIVTSFPGAPSGSCVATQLAVRQDTGALYSCQSGSWTPAGTGGSFIAPNSQAFYLSTACASGLTNCYTIHADAKVAVNAAFTSGQNTVSTGSGDPPFVCPGASFPCSSGGDVGKVEFANYGCSGGNPGQCNKAGSQGTISSIQDAHDAIVSSNWTHSSASNTGGNGNTFLWGTLDDTGISNAVTAALAIGGGTIVLPCNVNIMISQAPFIRASSSASVVQAFDIQGCASTNLIPDGSGFNLTSCNVGCIYYDSVAPGQNYLNSGASRFTAVSNLNVFGGGFDCTGCSLPVGTKAAIYLFNQAAYNVNVTGWDWNIASLAGFDGYSQALFDESSSYATGGTACTGETATGGGTIYRGGICNSSIGVQPKSGSQIILDGTFVFDFGGNYEGVYATAGTMYVDNSYIGGTVFVQGGILHMTNDYVAGLEGGFGGVYSRGNSSMLYMTNVTDAGAVGFTLGDTGGSPSMFDLGGNVSTATPNIAAGTLSGSASITGACVAGNLAASAGWGSTAAFSAVSGGPTVCTFTLTNSGTGQGANPTITLTFPSAFWATPSGGCQAIEIGGNQPLTATSPIFATTSTSKTAAVFTYNGTPTINDTEQVRVSCSNP